MYGNIGQLHLTWHLRCAPFGRLAFGKLADYSWRYSIMFVYLF